MILELSYCILCDLQPGSLWVSGALPDMLQTNVRGFFSVCYAVNLGAQAGLWSALREALSEVLSLTYFK